MSFPNKLRMQGELPYNPAVPDPLPDAPPPPPPPPDGAYAAAYAAPAYAAPAYAGPAYAAPAQPEILSEGESDIMDKIDAQNREDAREESVPGALLGGLAAAALCILLAGGIAALTHYWHTAFSVCIGFGVACAVKRFGRGNDIRFGFIGAFCALVACVGGYHLAWAFVLAAAEDMSFLDYVASVDNWGTWMTDRLRPFDWLFYVVATYCGYKYSYDAVADKY